jgi:hypothetical protein
MQYNTLYVYIYIYQVLRMQAARQQQQQRAILRATSSRKNRSGKNALKTVLHGTLPSYVVMLSLTHWLSAWALAKARCIQLIEV